MSRYVTDTHALYWHLEGSPKLSETARQIFREADAGNHQIMIPSIVLVEMVYLVEKGRIDRKLAQKIFGQLDAIDGSYEVASLDSGTVEALQSIPRDAVPDMPDRIISATAYQLELPLITRDSKIQKAGVLEIIW